MTENCWFFCRYVTETYWFVFAGGGASPCCLADRSAVDRRSSKVEGELLRAGLGGRKDAQGVRNTCSGIPVQFRTASL